MLNQDSASHLLFVVEHLNTSSFFGRSLCRYDHMKLEEVYLKKTCGQFAAQLTEEEEVIWSVSLQHGAAVVV